MSITGNDIQLHCGVCGGAFPTHTDTCRTSEINRLTAELDQLRAEITQANDKIKYLESVILTYRNQMVERLMDYKEERGGE